MLQGVGEQLIQNEPDRYGLLDVHFESIGLHDKSDAIGRDVVKREEALRHCRQETRDVNVREVGRGVEKAVNVCDGAHTIRGVCRLIRLLMTSRLFLTR